MSLSKKKEKWTRRNCNKKLEILLRKSINYLTLRKILQFDIYIVLMKLSSLKKYVIVEEEGEMDSKKLQ